MLKCLEDLEEPHPWRLYARTGVSGHLPLGLIRHKLEARHPGTYCEPTSVSSSVRWGQMEATTVPGVVKMPGTVW